MLHCSVPRAIVLVFLALFAEAAQAATLELISGTGTATDSWGTSTQSALSADGRYVAFLSSSPNLVPGQQDDNDTTDVFLHDRLLGTTTLVSHAAGSPTRPASSGPFIYLSLDISADGRYVAFSGPSVALVPGAISNGLTFNVFLWDRVTGTTTLVSHAAGSPGTAADDSSFYVRISADGNFLVFTSLATNLVAGQTDHTNPSGSATEDVFLWNRATDTTTLVSRKSGTTLAITGNQPSFNPVISADGGVVVFPSSANDLLPNLVDLSSGAEVYAYQYSTNTLSLVSRSATSPQVMAGAANDGAAVSADGRYVVFASDSADLVPGQLDDNAPTLDAFLYDRATGEMRLVSHRGFSPLLAGGIPASSEVAMSADGRYVAFSSAASNFAQDTNGTADVFVYDRDTGLIVLASHRHDSATTAGSTGDIFIFGGSGRPRLSADGRFLVFHSFAVDLVPGQADVPGTSDVFLYDRISRKATLVSRTRASASTAGNEDSFSPVLSADGGVVAFLSEATDLGEGQADPYGFLDLFLYQRTSGEVTHASRHDPGLPLPLTSRYRSVFGSLSTDGRSVAFRTRDDAFLRDIPANTADTTTLLSPPLSPPYTQETSQDPVLSADGRFVAFLSYQDAYPEFATGLFLYDRAARTFTLVNHAPGSTTQIDGFASGRFFGLASSVALSADGRYIAYACEGCGLVPGHSNPPDVTRFQEIFLYDRLSGENTLVSRAVSTDLPALRPDGQSYSPSISADGRYVAFWSFATNLVPGQVDFSDTLDLFVFNRETGATSLITHRPGFPPRSASLLAPPSFSFPVPANLSADGRFLAFQSTLPNLVDGQVDANGETDVFLHDQFAGTAGTARTTVLVSHAASSPVTAGNGHTFFGSMKEAGSSMSADGRFLVYSSLSTDLVAGAGDTNGAGDVFLYDRLTGINSLMSHNGTAPLTTANGNSGVPRISADGSRIAFQSTAMDLVPSLIPGQTVTAGWYHLYTRPLDGTGTTAFLGRTFRSSRPSVVDSADGVDDPLSFVPRLSANGRRIAFSSEAGLVPGDYNNTWDVYLWDQDGTVEPEGPIAVAPCRLFDTRRRAERPVLTSNVQRAVTVRGACGVPATAKQVVVKVAVLNPTGKGNLRFYPGAVTATPSGILRFERNATRTETFTLPLSTNGTLTILPFVAGKGTVHGVVEVTGYSN